MIAVVVETRRQLIHVRHRVAGAYYSIVPRKGEGNALVIKENLVRLDHMPLVMRIPSLPNMAPDSYVKLEISNIDLLDRSLQAQFIEKLIS